MSEDLRAKAGLVYNIVESVVLAMSVGLMVWMANVVITHGQTLATHGTLLSVLMSKQDKIETKGSDQLQSHVVMDDGRVDVINKRLEKLEAAVLVLQQTPGELKSIGVELRNIRDSQQRLEKLFDEHLKDKKL